jgi:hypothetical protein
MAGALQYLLAGGVDLAVQVVDQCNQTVEPPTRHGAQLEPGEKLAAALAEHVGPVRLDPVPGALDSRRWDCAVAAAATRPLLSPRCCEPGKLERSPRPLLLLVRTDSRGPGGLPEQGR